MFDINVNKYPESVLFDDSIDDDSKGSDSTMLRGIDDTIECGIEYKCLTTVERRVERGIDDPLVLAVVE